MTYGKFASAEELLKGYNQLEKSFTQKCQQLAALKATVDKSQQELPIEKIENSNVETASATPTVETETTATTENQNETTKVATQLDGVAEVSQQVSAQSIKTDMERALKADTEISNDDAHCVDDTDNADSAAPSQASQKSTEIDSERAPQADVTAPNTSADGADAVDTQSRKTLVANVETDGAQVSGISADNARAVGGAVGANAEGALVKDTDAPKTLASARDAATKLFESNSNPLSSDGTSVETPPSSAEQSTTVDSADTVPQSGIDAPVLDGHAAASPTESQLQQYLLNNPKIAWQLLQQTSQPPQIMTGGGNVSLALPSRPKTLKEASLMAKQLFKN